MNYKENLFNTIRLLFLAIIVAELGTIKAIITPSCIQEYISILHAFKMYIEHLILSIVFLSFGALIYLKQA